MLEAELLTIIFKASSFSSRSLLRSFSRRRRRCSTANSASVYVRSTLWRCCMPRVHPPRLGTLVNPWHRGKKNTVTWSKVTLPRRAFFAFFGMDVAMEGWGKMTLEYSVIKNFHTFFQMLLLRATRWRNAPSLVMCANPAERLSGTPLGFIVEILNGSLSCSPLNDTANERPAHLQPAMQKQN